MNCQKSLFSLPESVHYLNCATMSPLSKAVEAAGIAGVLRKSQPQEIYPEHFFDLLETVKARFAQLIGCTNPQRIALMPSVSYGLAVVAKNIARRADISRRPNIVLVGDEFPSDVYAWDELLADHSARIVTVKAPPYGAGRGAAWNEQLLAAIDEQMQRGIMLKGEYFLTDTITMMIEHGAKVRTNQISTWLDTGTIEATLDTNRILLDRGADNSSEAATRPTVKIVPPVFIHPTAEVDSAVIGPYVSIGANCKISAAVIQDSIIEEGTQIKRAALKRSLIGSNCHIEGQTDKEEASSLNIGDNSSVIHP